MGISKDGKFIPGYLLLIIAELKRWEVSPGDNATPSPVPNQTKDFTVPMCFWNRVVTFSSRNTTS